MNSQCRQGTMLWSFSIIEIEYVNDSHYLLIDAKINFHAILFIFQISSKMSADAIISKIIRTVHCCRQLTVDADRQVQCGRAASAAARPSPLHFVLICNYDILINTFPASLRPHNHSRLFIHNHFNIVNIV